MSNHAPVETSSAPIVFRSRSASPWIAAASLLTIGETFRLRAPLKFFVRALAQPRLTHAWLARIIQPDLAELWAAHPRLATKLQRPYVSCQWTRLERFAALMGHYDSLTRVLSPKARRAAYDGGLSLVRLATPVSGRALDVRLVYRDQFEKEGELTLVIHDVATDLILAGITFCMAYNDSRRLMVVGGLQASPDPRMRDLIHDIAKECHGFRPKALALWCLQVLASKWGIAQIQAVGDEQHIYRHAHKRRDFSACYDEFWSESDGHRLSAGSWELPLELRVRSREELKPNRRKTHERRYAMLAALEPHLVQALEEAKSATVEPRRVTLLGRESAPVAERELAFHSA